MALFKVEEVSAREELDGIADCIWTVMENSDSAHLVFYPVLGDRSTALNECKQRLWNEHTSDPSSNWVFVRDVSSKSLEILGACQWRIYKQNRFLHGIPNVQATWWPEGGGRDFATEFIRQCMSPRVVWMPRPHTGLSWCVVLPEQQRRGIGQALMSWGLSRTDKAGLESYVEATPAGRKLYERCGYHFVARVNIVVKNTDGDETWKDLESRVLPSGYDSIWRPILGVCEKGEPQRTWKDRLRSA